MLTTWQTIKALARKESLQSDANKALGERGVDVVPADLKGPKDDLVAILQGVDVVVSCITAISLADQIPLAEAAKAAGVKRFVPCDWATTAPRGTMMLADMKDGILTAIQGLGLGYTVIQVGWWSSQTVMALPSGRTDHAIVSGLNCIPGDGTAVVALTDLPDVGKYAAKIIADPETVNKKILAYTEAVTLNEAADILEEVSGEKPIKNYQSADTIRGIIGSAAKTLETDPNNQSALYGLVVNQYFDSWGVRGDSSPESAKKIGYLDFRELYPEVRGKTLRELYKEIVDEGSAKKA
ncbi:isoflavone reductase family protein [Xylariomycetidae sp. FL2044]|nr:isoflavone reductase family protein [Xylariomycetidae sp. FL2044]